MTWSIVARDQSTGKFGIAIASRVIAVGAMCPMFRDGAGALSSQSYTSPVAGHRMLTALAEGREPEAAMDRALDGDNGRMWRQIHGIDATGRPFAHTGESCIDWCGYWTGEAVSIAGNMLAGPQVLEATVAAWTDATAGLLPTGCSRPWMQARRRAAISGDDNQRPLSYAEPTFMQRLICALTSTLTRSLNCAGSSTDSGRSDDPIWLPCQPEKIQAVFTTPTNAKPSSRHGRRRRSNHSGPGSASYTSTCQNSVTRVHEVALEFCPP